MNINKNTRISSSLVDTFVRYNIVNTMQGRRAQNWTAVRPTVFTSAPLSVARDICWRTKKKKKPLTNVQIYYKEVMCTSL